VVEAGRFYESCIFANFANIYHNHVKPPGPLRSFLPFGSHLLVPQAAVAAQPTSSAEIRKIPGISPY